jgi:uncharacterized membrane protein YbhN (UPF0104 family)
MKRGKKLISLLIGLLVSVVLMAVLFHEIEFEKLVQALQQANYWWLLPNISLIVVSMYLRAYRWAYMIRPIKNTSFQHLLSATCIGFMANNVLPLRLGEFVRAYSLAFQDREISKSASLATIFVERMVFDLVALLLILAAVISTTVVVISDQMKTGIYISLTVALLGLAFVLLLAMRPERAVDLFTRHCALLASGAPGERARLSSSSRGGWSSCCGRLLAHSHFTPSSPGSLGCIELLRFVAFGFDLPLDASFFLLVVVSIAILVPSSPGFVGVYHGGTVFTLLQYGVGREDALSFALVLHAAQYIPITLMGFYFLRKSHLSLGQLEGEAVHPDPE